MCRIALVINGNNELIERIGRMQLNGSNRDTEVWRKGNIAMIHNRFAVTSQTVPVGTFPLEGERYILNYNGEVYGYGATIYSLEEGYESDAHFALKIIDSEGIEAFLADVDFQGTYQIYDKETEELYVIVDQLNTSGCFYAEHEGAFVMASEYPVVHAALEMLGAPETVPIEIMKNGTYLKITKGGEKIVVSYRPDFQKVFGGTEYSLAHFEKKIVDVQDAIERATLHRIPREGIVGVLCSGGVDSSLLLVMTVKILEERGELDRMKVFSFGDTTVGQGNVSETPEENDLLNVLVLFQHLQLDPAQYLHIISPEHIREWQQYLLRGKVFSAHPRLIPPNPILQTHVRHTVMQSAVMASIIDAYPEIITLITGDAADELFVGYNSMRDGVSNGEGLARNLRDKLNDLPLNDAARIALSCYHGTQCVLKHALKNEIKEKNPETVEQFNKIDEMSPTEIEEALQKLGISEVHKILEKLHPIEVRMPYTSHIVLRTVQDAHPDYLIGSINGNVLPKFILRMVALRSGVPASIVSRKKIPFNEGGSGRKNDEREAMEFEASREHISLEKLHAEVEANASSLKRLGLIEENASITQEYVQERFDILSLFVAAFGAGLERMLRDNVFRAHMPDAVYSTKLSGKEYQPKKLLTCSTDDGESQCQFVES